MDTQASASASVCQAPLVAAKLWIALVRRSLKTP